jgi:N-acetylmuramoyl-L-alanine amidase
MIAPPTRDRQTREMIQRFQARRRRRRRMRLLLASLGGLALVALITAMVVLASRDGDDQTLAGLTGVPSTGGTTTPAGGTTDVSGAGSGEGGTTLPVTTTATTATTAPPTTAAPTTTSTVTTTTAVPATSSTTPQPAGLVVVIDAGHQAKADYSLEPVGPGSSEQKAKVSSGTAGVVTGTPESELVLAVALKLRDSLEAHEIQVVMTRTSQDVNISNSERAQMANEAGADLFVRVHADGNADSAVHGIHVLYPASIAGWTDDIAADSKRAAGIAQDELIAATGAKDRGIDARGDMTGFNWSDVPVFLPEIGFMTNAAEDKLLATDAYQDKIVQALTQAILAFLGAS